MHDLKAERFYTPDDQRIAGDVAGPIKTFRHCVASRIRHHIARWAIAALEDAIEFFNLIQELKLTKREKADLVAFLRAL
jgi:hypothetical protein